jgi:2'-5' RNA ligase
MTGAIRAFLAVEVADEIKQRLIDLKCELAAGHREVRWVRDEGLHVTVKFLGSVKVEVMSEVEKSLRQELAPQPAFPARVEGVGAFPATQRPRAIWAGVNAPELSEVAARVEHTLAPLGFAPEKRPFHAHVTLGRTKQGLRPKKLTASLSAHAADRFGDCRVTELTAFKSDLRPDGAVYTKLWSIPFRN